MKFDIFVPIIYGVEIYAGFFVSKEFFADKFLANEDFSNYYIEEHA